MEKIIPEENIQNLIYSIRGMRVMFDSDLASLYGVPTHRLNEQVKRNHFRFPADFMFQLTEEEWRELRSHFAISKKGGRRYMPYVFTEQGVAMLSSVLNSKQAIEVNIQIMRTFVQLRKMVLVNKELIERLDKLEAKYDKQFSAVFDAIRALMRTDEKPKRSIGFHSRLNK